MIPRHADEVMERIARDFPSVFETDSGCYHDCPPGWEATVRELCTRLVAEHPSVRCIQCKSKFGSLRFYFEGDESAAVAALIHEYETRCGETCERCGAAGKTVSVRGWLSALCPIHETEKLPGE